MRCRLLVASALAGKIAAQDAAILAQPDGATAR